MTEQEPDPVERLAQLVRQADVRLADTQRARGAQALVERLRHEEGTAPVASTNRRRHLMLWASLGLAAAAALLVALTPRRPPSVARAPAPAVSSATQPSKPIAERSLSAGALAILRPLNEPESESGRARLATRAGEELRAWLADCGRVVVRAESVLAVEENDPGRISLRLERGTVLVSFDRDSGRGLSVRTRDAMVRVTGTVFAVSASDGPTRVSVSRGSVEVAAGALPVSVSAGKSWQVGAASLGAPDPGTALALRELRALDTSRAAPGPARAPRPVGAPVAIAPNEAPEPGPPAEALPREVVATQPERSAESIYRAAEQALSAGHSDVAKGLLETLVTGHPNDALAAPATYELARLSFNVRDYHRARAQLRRLSDSRASAAVPFREPAGFLLCRSELELGARQAALSCLERFRAAFPESPHEGDALALLATLRFAERDCKRGRPLADEYLRRFPNGEHAPRLQQHAERCR